jgi:hypothetical protein
MIEDKVFISKEILDGLGRFRLFLALRRKLYVRCDGIGETSLDVLCLGESRPFGFFNAKTRDLNANADVPHG